MTYFAHSENQHGKRHPLSEHLTCVGRMAEEFAGDARWSAEARCPRPIIDPLRVKRTYAPLGEATLHGVCNYPPRPYGPWRCFGAR